MLELKNINKRFGERQILKNFNLNVPEKKILAIVGQSGGGKTTLLRMLAGLETIDSGQVLHNGQEIPASELASMNLLGFVFQVFSQMEGKLPSLVADHYGHFCFLHPL